MPGLPCHPMPCHPQAAAVNDQTGVLAVGAGWDSRRARRRERPERTGPAVLVPHGFLPALIVTTPLTASTEPAIRRWAER
jgi:hypothetical protein